jgi:hypothetical protein
MSMAGVTAIVLDPGGDLVSRRNFHPIQMLVDLKFVIRRQSARRCGNTGSNPVGGHRTTELPAGAAPASGGGTLHHQDRAPGVAQPDE